jgi:hypothetical protein
VSHLHETHVRGESVAAHEGDVFNEQPCGPFPFASRRRWISPQPREIGRKVQNRLLLLRLHDHLGCYALTLIDVLSFGKFAQSGVPLGFQHVGDQTVIRMHLPEPMLRELTFVACTLHVLLTQAIGLLHACLDLGLNSQRHFQVQGCDRVHQQFTDGGIECFAVDALADGLRVVNSCAHADVRRDLPLLVQVIAHGHPVAASAADHQALQESWSFSGWAGAPFGSVTLGRLVQLDQVSLVLSPGDVARMRVADQDLPLIARQPLDVHVPVAVVMDRRPTIAEGTRVAWIVEHPSDVIVCEGCPAELALCRARSNALREHQVLC